MHRTRTFIAVTAALALVSLRATAQTDFNWSGQVTTGQTLEIKGVNGDIRALPSSTTGAQVTATKSARRSDPNGVRIEVVPHAGGVTICAVYPDVAGQEPNRCEPGANSRMRTKDNDTQVRFEVHVPAGVNFVGRTVNGSVEGDSLNGDAEAHSVNGSVSLSTSGLALGSTVNGSLNLTMGRADWPTGAKFSTVNGGITLRLPIGVSAALNASTVNGDIISDFPITLTGQATRRSIHGTIGAGGPELTLSTVNGGISLQKAP
jgi:putative adhesin